MRIFYLEAYCEQIVPFSEITATSAVVDKEALLLLFVQGQPATSQRPRTDHNQRCRTAVTKVSPLHNSLFNLLAHALSSMVCQLKVRSIESQGL